MDEDLTRKSYAALMYDTRREYRRVIDGLTAFIAEHPSNSHALNNRAVAYLETGRRDEASADLDAATNVSVDDAMPFMNRAEVRSKAGQIAAAVTDLSRAIELDPSSPYLRFRRARAFLQLGQEREALVDLEQAVEGGLAQHAEERDRLRSKLGL